MMTEKLRKLLAAIKAGADDKTLAELAREARVELSDAIYQMDRPVMWYDLT